MVLYGASGHGRVVAEILRLSGVNEIVFWDDDPAKYLPGFKIDLPLDYSQEEVIICIGNNSIRRHLAVTRSYSYGVAVHPGSVLSPDLVVDAGSVIMAGSVINVGSKIGKHCIINTASVLDHDALIEDYVHISPNATLSGNVTVKAGSWIGAGSTIVQGLTIGRGAIVGAGAVILHDVPDYAVIVGNPGRIIRFNPELNF